MALFKILKGTKVNLPAAKTRRSNVYYYNGTKYKITVADDGTLTATAV